MERGKAREPSRCVPAKERHNGDEAKRQQDGYTCQVVAWGERYLEL
jgi:hypothetical protein